ncbi:hypothetical protein DM02DRAFT_620987 [Periconia macrospinosa]|uniref:Uncharacterized protein n=1 Tax=Periconia macrospinosa TaxID=97972 RepID=A0A2V1CXM9_9PLEO|nr:hypothetical protein DM02DRAFT_620987 [Periconia macrospinosa]
MPVDRRPSPGRIVNPRAANEEGAEPILSRGDPNEWPASDKHYSNRSYFHYTPQGEYVEDSDAPQGPPKKKGRYKNPERTKWEKDRYLTDPNSIFHTLHLCYSRGKDGRPTYDRAGYRLDYEKVADWMKMARPKALTSKQSARLQQKMEDDKMMAEMFFEQGAKPEGFEMPYQMGALKERVSKDLGIMWHEVGLNQVKEWDKRAFPKAKKGEYQVFCPEYEQKIRALMEGSALRVGKFAR